MHLSLQIFANSNEKSVRIVQVAMDSTVVPIQRNSCAQVFCVLLITRFFFQAVLQHICRKIRTNQLRVF